MFQEKLIQTIYKKIAKQDSMNEKVAEVLDISYDAAHRRVSLKSKFSIEEAALLARHFGLSLDKLYAGSENLLVQKTKEIESFDDMEAYLKTSVQALLKGGADANTSLIYSSKDIPLFYTIGTDLLSKFKLFVWLYLLDFGKGELSFENFKFEAPFLEYSQQLKNYYNSIQVHEIWNDTTINSTLQQILYFFHSGLLSFENAKYLCEELKELILQLEKKVEAKNQQFSLYYHELLLLNNNVLVSTPTEKTLFVPYTMLGYFITSDKETCDKTARFYAQQLKNSQLLNTVGVREKKMFFNRAQQKVDYFANQIVNIVEF